MEETPIALAQGNGLSVMRRKLVGRGADSGLVEILPLPGQLLAMVGDSSHLFYLESQATEPVRLHCILHPRSQPRTLYNFDKLLFPAGRATLALSETHILCPEGSAIQGIPKPGDQGSF